MIYTKTEEKKGELTPANSHAAPCDCFEIEYKICIFSFLCCCGVKSEF